jgi:hypothetical protein
VPEVCFRAKVLQHHQPNFGFCQTLSSLESGSVAKNLGTGCGLVTVGVGLAVNQHFNNTLRELEPKKDPGD